MRIILLDLNYTLVSNSDQKIHPFEKQILKEEYREDLIYKLKNDFVVLVTARPEHHKRMTLRNLKRKTGWLPMDAFFNNYKSPPPQCKEKILTKYLILRFNIEKMLAIESNPRTRAMYKKHNIKAVTYQEFMEEL